MGRSDSSDSEYERRRRKKQKKDRHRSRSRSSSSERNSRRYKSRRSPRERSRSRSRESKNRSKSKSYRRSRSRSRDRKDISHKRRNRSRSKSLDRDNYSKYRSESEEKPKSGWDVVELQNSINDLQETSQIIPSHEAIEKIEKDSFVQEHFSSTVSNSANMPKQRKKKKKGKIIPKQNTDEVTSRQDLQKELTVSHESAIFGTSFDAIHAEKFSSRIDQQRKEELKTLENDDLIFGAMFCDDPDARLKRWLEKLTLIRKRLRNEIVETE